MNTTEVMERVMDASVTKAKIRNMTGDASTTPVSRVTRRRPAYRILDFLWSLHL
jgi:hypothetical protein